MARFDIAIDALLNRMVQSVFESVVDLLLTAEPTRHRSGPPDYTVRGTAGAMKLMSRWYGKRRYQAAEVRWQFGR
jgi:hypothetical protein